MKKLDLLGGINFIWKAWITKTYSMKMYVIERPNFYTHKKKCRMKLISFKILIYNNKRICVPVSELRPKLNYLKLLNLVEFVKLLHLVIRILRTPQRLFFKINFQEIFCTNYLFNDVNICSYVLYIITLFHWLQKK